MKRIPLHGKKGKGKSVIVDDDRYDYLMQWDWYVHSKGYVVRYEKGTSANIFLHKEVFKIKKEIRRIFSNGNKFDCRIENLKPFDEWKKECQIPEFDPVTGGVRIKLHGKYGKGKSALIDLKNFEYLNQWKWHLNSYGYAVRCSYKKENEKKTIFMHREILKPPKGVYTDHINGDPLNNLESNLRLATPRQNSINTKLFITNKTGYRGVYWDTRDRKYRVKVFVYHRAIHVGYFIDIIEAAKAYNEAAKKYYGEFARLNNIPAKENTERENAKSCSY